MNDLTDADMWFLLAADIARPSAAPVIPLTCSECGGSGYDWTDLRHGETDCPRCHGSGMEPRS